MSAASDSTGSGDLSGRLDRLDDRLSKVLGEVESLARELAELRAAAESNGRPAEQDTPRASTLAEVADAASMNALPADPAPEDAPPKPPAAISGVEPTETTEEPATIVLAEGEPAVDGERAPGRLVAAASSLRRLLPERAAVTDTPSEDDDPLDLETRIGAVWFLRGGLLFVVIAFALAARWVVPELAPWHRVLASYAGAALVFGLGLRSAARLPRFARPVMAAGLALGFFTSFGAYFLPPLRCLPLAASLALMTLFILAILLCAERWRAQSVAGLAILFGHVAAFVASADADVFSMIAVLFLSATAVALMLRHDWMPLAFFSVFAAYVSHLSWTLREGGPAQVDGAGFGLHLGFLTAYYLLYLAADAAFTHRVERRGRDAFSQRQRVTGRAIGPTAMVLYATLGAALFQSSAGAWDRVHYFFLPLAAVQLMLLGLHHRKRTADVPLYVTAATVFATLGLFSMLGGLSLNLALAAEALLLLLLSRAISFGFLRHLARGVLAVNFVYFWFSPARELDGWPTFIGALLMAAVYFVRARQNETWEPLPPDERLSAAGAWSLLWHRVFRPLTVPLAHGQTLAGAVLVVYQCDKFLGPPWNVAAVALLAAAGSVAGLKIGSAPLLQGMFWLQLGAALLLWAETMGWAPVASAPGDWWAHQLAVTLLAATATVAMALARRARRRVAQRFAVAGVGATLIAAFAAGGPALAPPALPVAWTAAALLPIALAWAALELWPRPAPGQAIASARRRRRFHRDRRWRIVLALLIAEVAIWSVVHAAASAFEALLVLALAIAGLGVAALLRGTPYLLLGLLVHLGATGALALGYLDAATAEHSLLRWTILAQAAVLAVLMLVVCPRRRRASFGVGALASFALAIGMMTWLAVLPDQRFAPLWPWGATAAVLLLAVELLRSNPARRVEDWASWADRRGEALLRLYSRPLAGLGAVLTSAVFGLIIGRACTYNREALWAMAVTSALLLAATVVRNSPYMMAALLTQLGLMGAYRVMHGRELVQRPVVEWASVSLIVGSAALLMLLAPRLRRASFAWGALIALTFGMGGLAELLFNHRPGPSPSWWWLLTFALLWTTVEALRRGFGEAQAGDDWLDRFDLAPLVARARAMAVIFSAAGALLLIALSWRQFPSPSFMIFVTVLYAVLFVLLTAVLKSPPMAAAFAVSLTAAHPLFYLRVGAQSAVGTSPQLALLLLAVTLGAGGVIEWIFRHHQGPAHRRPAWWAAWYAYGLGFVLAMLFLGPLGEALGGAAAFAAPMQVALALVGVALGRALGLRWAIRAALLYALAAAGGFVLSAVLDPGYRVSLALAGGSLALALLLVERLLVGKEPEELWRSAPPLGAAYRPLLVAVAALVALVGLSVGPELAGVWTTAGWSLLALALIVLGFVWRDRIHRRTALAVFALAILRLAVLDVARLEIYYRMLAFLCLGASMVVVSFLYSRYREHIARWL